ncbi:MAG: flavin monoamine oxidase family protein [Janthinobacterium lividum]
MSMTRRNFLSRVGQAGGYSATFATMQALGMFPMKAVAAEAIAAAPGSGKGVSIVVAGGGISGLVTAYELKKLGFTVTLLEARTRPGGRNHSARNGTVVEFIDGTKQTCTWEEGHYQNLGPGRLPSVHTTMLNYCRELNVPLEVEINTSRSSLLQNDAANGGAPMVQRKALNDTRGHVSELLAKAIKGGALDQDLTKEDKDRMASFLRTYGPLGFDGKYHGSDRAGFKQYPGAADQVAINQEPTDMHTLLDENFWAGILYEEAWDWQATMMQPVGGMDRIPYAFAAQLEKTKTIIYDAPISSFKRTGANKGVEVTYKHHGAEKTIKADYMVNYLPLTQLKKMQSDLSAPYMASINGATYASSYKLAWESRRFWEQDYQIYGGLSFRAPGPTTVIWYPSAKLLSPKGILCTGYEDEMNWGWEKLGMQEKFETARKQLEKIHPGNGKELTKPLICMWRHIPYNEGSWIRSYGGGDVGYKTLLQPDGPIFFAGDHTTHIVGWQEGAALSGKRAAQMICDQVKVAKLGGAHHPAEA